MIRLNKKFAILAVVLVSALSSCGKKASTGSSVGVGSSGFGYSYNGGNNGCANVSGSFPISGPANIGASGFSANTTVGGSGYVGGNTLRGANSSGDSMTITLSGGSYSQSSYSQGNLVGTVQLGGITIAAMGNACITNIIFNNVGVTPSGQIYGNIIMYTSQGAMTLYM